jgi:Na(+)/H(+) antiporter
MVWDQLAIDKPHVAYMILGGFTSLFMLCSLLVKEKLYIGEATVATICGIIFGPYAANLFNPDSWGNVDKITLECSRIVLVVQCFAVGVELPKAYMERHWKSVVLLLVPVMTWGWLATSLFIWWMVPPLSWLESLVCAACVTATDPVLASSVVGKGKFAKRVPKHLRDVLSAESGCNDGMAFPFIYLSLYILHYRPNAGQVFFHWFCNTILYECIFGAFYGFVLGYIARHAIKYAEKKNLIDRESFLVFYFVLALFCAGSGSLLGMDDLLVGFSAGVGFSNDGWFTGKTEESHVSNVIDLLLNLAYFVYFGSIIPWSSYNDPEIGLYPWRLVVISILVIFFRRIPIMMLLKPIIPDVKTWREAIFAGHFGPIGVGAIFAAILTRAELEGTGTEPLAQSDLPGPGQSNYYIVQLIWPITTFMVISSIIVHGSSIAVFTLGKRINTLTITLSYTTANEEGPSWMNRLPRIQSLSKNSLSLRKADSAMSSTEQLPEYPPGTLPPIGVPGNFLRRVREEDEEAGKRTPSVRSKRRRKRAARAGGPISQSAIAPQRRPEISSPVEKEGDVEEVTSDAEKEAEKEREERDRIERESSPPTRERDRFGREPEIEVYREGDKMVIEDEEGNVLKTEDTSHESSEEQQRHILEQDERLQKDQSGEFAKSKGQPHGKTEGEEIQRAVGEKTGYQTMRQRLGRWAGFGKEKRPEAEAGPSEPKPKKRSRQSAHAYQFGNTIIVEDEDGEVIKKYTIPTGEKPRKDPEAPPAGAGESGVRRGLHRMGTWVGRGEKEGEPSRKATDEEDAEDDGLRFTLANDPVLEERGVGHRGKRLNKQDFINEIRKLDPKSRRSVVEETDLPSSVKQIAHQEARSQEMEEQRQEQEPASPPQMLEDSEGEDILSDETSVGEDSDSEVPTHDVAASLARYSMNSAAQERRRRLGGGTDAAAAGEVEEDSEDDGTERIPPPERTEEAGRQPRAGPVSQADDLDTGETPAERKRRLAALGEIDDPSDEDDDPEAEMAGLPRRPKRAVVREPDSEDDGRPRMVKGKIQFADGTQPARRKGHAGEADSSGPARSHGHGTRQRVSWGGERGRDM